MGGEEPLGAGGGVVEAVERLVERAAAEADARHADVIVDRGGGGVEVVGGAGEVALADDLTDGDGGGGGDGGEEDGGQREQGAVARDGAAEQGAQGVDAGGDQAAGGELAEVGGHEVGARVAVLGGAGHGLV